MHCHQYADDTQLYLSFTFLAADGVLLPEGCLASVIESTRANRLKLNSDKMEILLLGGPSDILGDNIRDCMREHFHLGIESRIGACSWIQLSPGIPDCSHIQVSL